MQFTTIAVALFASLASSLPAMTERQAAPYVPCSGLYGTAQCCATDVLGVADLDCQNPLVVPASPANFTSGCAAVGQRARCCVLPILGQDILCQQPAGTFGKKE